MESKNALARETSLCLSINSGQDYLRKVPDRRITELTRNDKVFI